MKKLLARALNKNQILILSEIDKKPRTITSTLTNLSKRSKIPLSTLKLNSKILKHLDLINFSNFSRAELTDFGNFIQKIIGGESDDW